MGAQHCSCTHIVPGIVDAQHCAHTVTATAVTAWLPNTHELQSSVGRRQHISTVIASHVAGW